jgi:aromatic ring-opening dioxygenase catalytic subunit (LigB family)
MTQPQRLPTLFISHGGGPCFFMKPGEMFPPGTWNRMAAHLSGIGSAVRVRPKALLVISAHWEEKVPTTYTATAPTLLYDYYGFPPSAYTLRYPAASDPDLAAEVKRLLSASGIACGSNTKRGFDHGVFIPMMLAYPEADIPIVQLSLQSGLDPESHLAIGRALRPLRDSGVLIIGSGMSYHNLGALGSAAGDLPASRFDAWLNDVVSASDSDLRSEQLRAWSSAPGASEAHPRAEHLAPLFVAAGAAGDDGGHRDYHDVLFGKAVSGFIFGGDKLL